MTRYPNDGVRGVRYSESNEVINELSLVSAVSERRGARCPALRHRYNRSKYWPWLGRYPTNAVRGVRHSGIDTTDQSIGHGWVRYPTDAVHVVRYSESNEVINELSLVSAVPDRRGARCPALRHRYNRSKYWPWLGRYPTNAVHGVCHSESKEVINELSLVSAVSDRRGARRPAHRYCKLLIFKLYYFYVTL